MNDEIEIKTERVSLKVAAEGQDSILINGQHNFAWITGGASNGIDASRDNGAATIVVTKDGKRYLLANNIEMPRMLAEQVDAQMFEPIEFSWQQEKADPELLVGLANDLAGPKVCSDISFTSARSIEYAITECRYELVDAEIERYRRLGNDTANAFSATIETVSPGMTENAIANKMRHELAKLNIASIVTLAAADERIAKYRHPVPTDNRLRKTLLLVTCARRHGLVASVSRMVCFGQPDAELIRRTEAAAFVNASLQHATRAGANGSELYAVAKNAYEQAGFADEIDKHHQGGATGYRTRDWVAHPTNGQIVKDQQAFAWNPSITGTKVEDTIIATANGVEVITASPEFPTIVTEIDERTYFSHGILSI